MSAILAVAQSRAEGLIGASTAAACLGLDRYRSPLAVWRELRGDASRDVDMPDFVREAAEFGQLLEPIVRGKYAVDRNVCVVVPEESTVIDGWLRATPDGLVYLTGDGLGETFSEYGELQAPDGLLQVKCRSAYLRDKWEHGAPAKEEVQVRVEMAVMGAPWCDVAVLIGGNQMLVHRVERDLEIEANILRDLRKFWDLVQSGTEPPVDASRQWTEFASSKMQPTKVTLTADEDMAELVAYWHEQRRKRKRAEEEETAAKTDLLLKLSAAGATAIALPNGKKVTAYRVGGRTDYKGWALELAGKSAKPPDKFRSEGTTWALRSQGDDE